MQNRAIFLESNRLEQQLINFQLEGALLEVMKNDLMARSIIAEHRKIEKYALQLGLVNKRQLNEGIFADVTLGLGQAIGSLPFLAQAGVGAAFGVAGVLWYGKEMLGNAVGSFDFFMNLIFALLSAAAIEPTGVFGEAGAFGKLIKPLAYLGQKVRTLGGMAKAAVGLGPAERVAAKAAAGAAGPLSRGLTFLSEVVLPKISGILESVKASVMKLPGGKAFTQISELITKYAGRAIEALKDALSPFLRHVETATVNAQIAGKEMLGKAGAKVAGAAAEALPSLIKRLSPQMAERIVAQFAGKTFTYDVAAGTRYVLPRGYTAASRAAAIAAGKKVPMVARKFQAYAAAVTLDSLKIGKGSIWIAQKGGNGFAVGAAQLPSFITQVAKSFGNEAAAAILVKAQAAFPQAVIMSAMKATSEANNSITMPAGA